MYCQNLDAIIQPFSYLAMQNISVFIVEIFISEYHNNGRNIQRELRQYLNESHLTGCMYTVQKIWGCTFHWGHNLKPNRLQQFPENNIKNIRKQSKFITKKCIIENSLNNRVNNHTTLLSKSMAFLFFDPLLYILHNSKSLCLKTLFISFVWQFNLLCQTNFKIYMYT